MGNIMIHQSKSFIIFLLFVFVTFYLYAQPLNKKRLINVTGSYKYIGKTLEKGDDVFGYFGKIKVKQLENGELAISFFLCKGAKSYSSGSFVDTLELNGTTAIYRPLYCDALCTLIFKFSKTGVTTIHKAADNDYNSSCCFGMGVVANGYFKKISSKTPLIKDQLVDWHQCP